MAFSGWRFSGWRSAVGGLQAVCVWRFASGLRLAVCGRSAFGGLRAVCVWRFEGGFSGSLRVVCGRFADSWRADCGWRFAGGLRLAVCGYDSVTKYTPRDQQNATPNPIKLRNAQRWTPSLVNKMCS